MGRWDARFRRRWAETWPWLVVVAAAYGAYFGAALLATAAYYDVDVEQWVLDSVPGWLFVVSTLVFCAYLANRFVDRFTPNFEPGHPRDEYLASTVQWFDDND